MQIKTEGYFLHSNKVKWSFSLLYVLKGCMYYVQRVISSISNLYTYVMWLTFIYRKIKGVLIFL